VLRLPDILYDCEVLYVVTNYPFLILDTRLKCWINFRDVTCVRRDILYLILLQHVFMGYNVLVRIIEGVNLSTVSFPANILKVLSFLPCSLKHFQNNMMLVTSRRLDKSRIFYVIEIFL
jgi:hypothetical protein